MLRPSEIPARIVESLSCALDWLDETDPERLESILHYVTGAAHVADDPIKQAVLNAYREAVRAKLN